MNRKYLAMVVMFAMTSAHVMAQNDQTPSQTTPNNKIEGTTAGGEQQTTIIDENGNLKMVNKPNASGQANQPATKPSTPATPSRSATPSTPVSPSMPATPSTPASPSMPVSPSMPATPSTPVTPSMPASPSTPATQSNESTPSGAM